MHFLDSIMYDSIYVGLNPEVAKEPFELSVFPNPLRDYLSINIDVPGKSDIIISLCDMQGREIHKELFKQEISSHHFLKIDLRDVAKGLYILRVETAGGIDTRKIIKQ